MPGSGVVPAGHFTFAGGELAPSLLARVDQAKYHSGLTTARNVIVMPQGGVRNRAGTQYIATAKDSTHLVRVVRFSVSVSLSYVLELGHQYIRFYTSDAQVGVGSPGAYAGGTAYVIGNIVSSAGVNYYCIADTTGNAPPNSTYWYALTGSIMEIPSPYSGADLFKLKFAQSADVIFIAGGAAGYAPRTLTFNASSQWVLALYVNNNGPFRAMNTTIASTITPSALTGSITLTATQSIFNTNQVGGLFEIIHTISGQTITPSLTTAAQNYLNTGTGATSYQAVVTGTWSGTILLQTSPDGITWTTVQSITSNNTYSGNTGFTTYGFFRAIMQSSLSFSGSATVALTGKGTSVGPTALAALSSVTSNAVAGDTVLITLTSLTATGDTVKLQRSDDGGSTWNDLASYTTNQAATSVATTKTTCLVRAIKSVHGGGTPSATVDGTTGAAPTLSVTVSTANVSRAIQCGANWSFISNGTWTGKVNVEISTDGGNNWNLVHSFASQNSGNENTSGQTGVRQCLLRVSTDPSTAFSGTATIDLSSSSFDWVGVVKLTAFSTALSVTATVQSLSNIDSTGLGGTSATWQWSEGSWSVYRGYPACVSFYQDRLGWASSQGTSGEPNTGWLTEVGAYDDFGTNSPLLDSDSVSFVLPGRQINSVQSMVQLLNALICLTSDSEYAVGPSGGTGPITPTNVDQAVQGHRGSSTIEPITVGAEILLIQQMGSAMRNLIFQLAVNGYFGDNISFFSQHLLTGYTIVEMAYQQEPDSIVWLVRSDGTLLSISYIKEQEMNAWTHHDTDGTFESACVIPNQTLGINEIWIVVNRTIGGTATRMIEVLKPRDQGTAPEDQWFVDCGLKYDSTPATVITGLTHLNGKTVAILADGNVQTQQLVSGGQITLGVAASVVIAGLPYTSDVETLPIELPGNQGTMQSRRVAIPRVVVRYLDSRGLYVMETNQDAIAPATGTVGMFPVIRRGASVNLNAPIPLRSGDHLVNLNGGYDKRARVFFRQTEPLPFTILAVMPDLVPSGR